MPNEFGSPGLLFLWASLPLSERPRHLREVAERRRALGQVALERAQRR
jgi:hypothetical protein